MPADDDYGEQHESGGFTDQLVQFCVTTLKARGHKVCDWSGSARYEPSGPEGPVVVCGCGEFYNVDPPSAAETTTAATLPYVARDPIESTLALIDPAEQYTPVDVERHILDVLYRLEVGALFERETIQKAYATQQAFDMAYNLAIHQSEQSSADRRKAEAMVNCQEQFEAATEAKMLKEAAKQTMHNLRAILSGYQSTARSVGSAYQAGGSQGGVPNRY
jgi:hypothetical protein